MIRISNGNANENCDLMNTELSGGLSIWACRQYIWGSTFQIGRLQSIEKCTGSRAIVSGRYSYRRGKLWPQPTLQFYRTVIIILNFSLEFIRFIVKLFWIKPTTWFILTMFYVTYLWLINECFHFYLLFCIFHQNI